MDSPNFEHRELDAAWTKKRLLFSVSCSGLQTLTQKKDEVGEFDQKTENVLGEQHLQHYEVIIIFEESFVRDRRLK